MRTPDVCRDCGRNNTRGTASLPAGCLKYRWPNDVHVKLECAERTIKRLQLDIDRRIRQSSTPFGKYECQCREPGLWGSYPDPCCEYCRGTGYTDDVRLKKDWSTYTPEELDSRS